MIRLLVIGVLLVACNERGMGGRFPDGGGSGSACGGFAGTSCSSNEFCDFARNSCGATDEQGTCRTRPTACPDLFDPVCGCDGVVHSNVCDANGAGTDVSAIGSCPVPAGEFTCGFRTCDLSNEFCLRTVSDRSGEPDSFSCMPLPAGCTSCGCMTDEPCGDFCDGTAASGLTLTCQLI
ncbi:MAG: hypothetical protein ACKV2T_27825 [Kofleriaceae bacterium]